MQRQATKSELIEMACRSNRVGGTRDILLCVRNLVGALVVGAALVLTPLAADSASAQAQRGLVNVAVGDVTILENVGVGVAAQVAANVCGVSVGNVAALASGVVQNQETATVCMTGPQGAQVPVTIQP
jgi:hypothetical protein